MYKKFDNVWDRGYYCGSAEHVSQEQVKRYILEQEGKDGVDYDVVCDFFEGWFAYAKHTDTYKLRRKLAEEIERSFPNKISTKEINRMTKEL